MSNMRSVMGDGLVMGDGQSNGSNFKHKGVYRGNFMSDMRGVTEHDGR
jgi:hypothetical protein